MDQVFSLKNETLKNTEKMGKKLEMSGNFVSPEKWEPWHMPSYLRRVLDLEPELQGLNTHKGNILLLDFFVFT